MSSLVDRGVQTVIATTVEIPMAFAAEFGQDVLRRFIGGGRQLDALLLDMRRTYMLEKNNMLGLVYELHGLGKLHVEWQQAEPAGSYSTADVFPDDSLPVGVPFDSLRSHHGRPLVNRGQLCQALRELASETGRRVLVVDGPPRSGKTYTVEFIHSLAQALGAFRVIYIDFDAVSALRWPDDLVQSIARLMGRSVDAIPTRRGAHGARWVRELVYWLIAEVKESRSAWWIVLDSLDSRDIPSETHDLIQDLAVKVVRSVPELRVVLLGYKGLLPADIADQVLREQIETIERLDLKEYFERLFHQRGEDADAAAVDVAVDAVLRLIPADQPDRLRYLSEGVEEVTKRLFTT